MGHSGFETARQTLTGDQVGWCLCRTYMWMYVCTLFAEKYLHIDMSACMSICLLDLTVCLYIEYD